MFDGFINHVKSMFLMLKHQISLVKSLFLMVKHIFLHVFLP